MNIFKFEFEYIGDASDLFELANSNENIDIIEEKNFSGDITTIELYVSLGINAAAVVVPIIKALIKQHKISSVTIDGNKIEAKNISEDLAEKIIMDKINNKSGE